MEYIVTRANNSDELYHYGVKGMKWGVHKAKLYGAKASYHIKRADKLQSKADVKRSSTMNTTNRRLKYAAKERKYANAEKFHNQKALGLSYVSKLLGTTLDYSYNKKRAGKDAILKEKYSQAKTGTTNRVNRLEYRAEKQRIKADKSLAKKKIAELTVEGKTKEKVNEILESSFGNSLISDTWKTTETYRDRSAKTNIGRDGYVKEKQRVF